MLVNCLSKGYIGGAYQPSSQFLLDEMMINFNILSLIIVNYIVSYTNSQHSKALYDLSNLL